jgi:RNA polymerase sigma-70 factor (ECF subfamily)
MSQAPITRPSLLVRLRNTLDAQAWGEFVDVYAPLVYGFLRKRGLQDADTADVTQEVLHAVSRALGRFEYDPQQGSFRGWLFTIVRNKLRNFQAGADRKGQGSGDSAVQHMLEQEPARALDEESLWIQEYEQRLFTEAALRVRPTVHETTWRAFWLTAVDGKKAAEAGALLNLGLAAVYLARSRVLARIRQEVQELQGGDAPFP